MDNTVRDGDLEDDRRQESGGGTSLDGSGAPVPIPSREAEGQQLQAPILGAGSQSNVCHPRLWGAGEGRGWDQQQGDRVLPGPRKGHPI